MRDRFPRPFALLALLLAAALIAGCGDDEESAGADTDPQTILDRALGGGEPIESGVLDLQFDLESASDPGGTISASLQGPFQSSGDGSLPELDFDITALVDAAGTNIDFEGGLTLTPDAGYISYAGKDYELDSGTYDLLQSSYEQSSQLEEEQGDENSLSQFGIDPSGWVTDLTNEGTEDLDGTEVVHVSGTADVAKLVDDLTTVAEQTGQAQELDPAALEQLNSSVERADIDVYAASDDSTLRKFDLAVELADPTGSGGGNTTVSLSIGIGDPGEDQDVEAPADAEPIESLLGQFPGGLDSLQGLGGTGTTAPSGDSGAGGGSSDAATQYFDCAAAATTPEEVDACAGLLDG